MNKVGDSYLSKAGSYFYSYIEGVTQRVDEYAQVAFIFIMDQIEGLPQLEDRRDELPGVKEFEKNVFDTGMRERIRFPMVDLSNRHSIQVIHGNNKEPKLFVKLPRGQLIHFPEQMRRNLLNCEEDLLDVFFAVFVLEEGQKEMTLNVPSWGQDHLLVSAGFYGGDGVERGRERTVPWHFIRQYSSEEASALNVGVTEDVGAFKMGAYLRDCTGPRQGVAVFGLILSQEGQGKAILNLIDEKPSLQTLVDTIGSEVTEIFTFNDTYRH